MHPALSPPAYQLGGFFVPRETSISSKSMMKSDNGSILGSSLKVTV